MELFREHYREYLVSHPNRHTLSLIDLLTEVVNLLQFEVQTGNASDLFYVKDNVKWKGMERNVKDNGPV